MSPEAGADRLARRVAALARAAHSSFYPALRLLPRPRRESMFALYTWCRRADDIVDGQGSVTERGQALRDFRQSTERALGGQVEAGAEPVVVAAAAAARRHAIDPALFGELLDGVEMDLRVSRYKSAEELEHYSYRVASVVGLMSIEVFGYQDAGARVYAVELGHALQLTNILRDVVPDLERDRIYLPLADLARHGVAEEDLLARRDSAGLRRAAGETAARARERFARAARAFPPADRSTLYPARIMGAVYQRLLDRIERGGCDVLGPRVRLGTWTKVGIAGRERLAAWLAPRPPGPGA